MFIRSLVLFFLAPVSVVLAGEPTNEFSKKLILELLKIPKIELSSEAQEYAKNLRQGNQGTQSANPRPQHRSIPNTVVTEEVFASDYPATTLEKEKSARLAAGAVDAWLSTRPDGQTVLVSSWPKFGDSTTGEPNETVTLDRTDLDPAQSERFLDRLPGIFEGIDRLGTSKRYVAADGSPDANLAIEHAENMARAKCHAQSSHCKITMSGIVDQDDFGTGMIYFAVAIAEEAKPDCHVKTRN